MSSKQTLRRGNQEPRIGIEPDRDFTFGEHAVELCASYGLEFDPWQEMVLCSWLGVDRYDMYVATRAALSLARQNGKNTVLEGRELFGLLVVGEQFLHSAHQVKTCRKGFLRLADYFEDRGSHPELTDAVSDIRYANGQEGIFFKNGANIEFIARSKSSGRGFTKDVVIADEAQEMTDEQLSALMFTISAAPLGNPQIIFTFTPPPPYTRGEVVRRIREDALSGKSERLAYHEWSVEEVGDVTDISRAYDTNPALGIRISERSVRDECSSQSPELFAIDRLGWWTSASADRILGAGEWESLLTDKPAMRGKTVYGIKFTADGAYVSVAAAVRPERGLPHVELVHYEPMSGGTAWLARWLTERKSRIALVVIDGRTGPAGSLIEKLLQGGFPKRGIKTTSHTEVATAASFFLDAVREKALTHIGQDPLDRAATGARKRPIGDGWGWGGDGDVDSSPVEAASLAHWGAMTTKRNPQRKQRPL